VFSHSRGVANASFNLFARSPAQVSTLQTRSDGCFQSWCNLRSASAHNQHPNPPRSSDELDSFCHGRGACALLCRTPFHSWITCSSHFSFASGTSYSVYIVPVFQALYLYTYPANHFQAQILRMLWTKARSLVV
jgi:hypothetical protein